MTLSNGYLPRCGGVTVAAALLALLQVGLVLLNLVAPMMPWAWARSPKNIPPSLYKDLLSAQMKAKAADDQMFKYMEGACTQMEAWYHRMHGFPPDPDSVRKIELELGLLAKDNPYAQDEFLSKQMEIEHRQLAAKVTYRLVSELGLSYSPTLSQAPPESWKAQPGVITIVHNEQDMLIIWASGADGNPIKDGTTGNARLLVRQLR